MNKCGFNRQNSLTMHGEMAIEGETSIIYIMKSVEGAKELALRPSMRHLGVAPDF